ncbi:MAG: TonB-dependent receptor, partial [Ignavibacteria bacterium]|nr:TonB-dependent receptor [Ignavibacteria bacterium]
KTVIPVFENLFSIDFSTFLYARQDKIYKGETETPGYVIFNTYINTKPVFIYQKSKYLIFYLGVENIFNKSYKNHLSSNRGNMYIEPGRNFFIKSTINL